MPIGGGYATTHSATQRLQAGTRMVSGRLLADAGETAPTYCSGATYLVFLKVIEELQARGNLQLDERTLGQLLIRGQADGQGVWGRWNANGPGTAMLFHELGLGPNFTSLSEARPGDFMKIFWTPEVGSEEHGHSVILLGFENRGGVDFVRLVQQQAGGLRREERAPVAHTSRDFLPSGDAGEPLAHREDSPGGRVPCEPADEAFKLRGGGDEVRILARHALPDRD